MSSTKYETAFKLRCSSQGWREGRQRLLVNVKYNVEKNIKREKYEFTGGPKCEKYK